jgi:hypothetical protein
MATCTFSWGASARRPLQTYMQPLLPVLHALCSWHGAADSGAVPCRHSPVHAGTCQSMHAWMCSTSKQHTNSKTPQTKGFSVQVFVLDDFICTITMYVCCALLWSRVPGLRRNCQVSVQFQVACADGKYKCSSKRHARAASTSAVPSCMRLQQFHSPVQNLSDVNNLQVVWRRSNVNAGGATTVCEDAVYSTSTTLPSKTHLRQIQMQVRKSTGS